MKFELLLLPLSLLLLSAGWFMRPKAIKDKLTGSWVCVSKDTEYSDRAFQLLFYKEGNFYYYLKQREPTPYVRGTFEVAGQTLSFHFNDTKEQHSMTILKVTSKNLSVEYNKSNLTFRRVAGLKTLP